VTADQEIRKNGSMWATVPPDTLNARLRPGEFMDLDKVKKEAYFNFRKVSSGYYSNYALPPYLVKVLPPDKSAKILDIGCGFGQILNALAKLGYENLRGVDISDEAIHHCRDLGLNVEKIHDLSNYMEKHQDEFDFIMMSHVLEHIEKALIIPYVSAIKAMLKKGGQFLVMVPNAQSNTDCYWAYEDFTHATLFTAGSLYFVLMAGGFTQVEFIDPCCVEGMSFPKKTIKLCLLKLFIVNKLFWNKVTSSSYHGPSPIIVSFEIKGLAR
jgi:2-polyprenyl-3-methyl-5-hydroxy-6-metoxy-1,4-benzoquinol methylase